MLRYILLKLSGITGKKEFSLSSSCNQMLMLRPSTSIKRESRKDLKRNDQERPQQKRSYSFPSRSTKSCRLLENDSVAGSWGRPNPQEHSGLDIVQKKSLHQKVNKITKKGTKSSSTVLSENIQPLSTAGPSKLQTDGMSLKNKYHEMSCFEENDRYELEAAKPRRSQSELLFNVFDYVARDVDLTEYLQPNNLKPFGSNENIYLPLLMSHKNLSMSAQTTPNYLQSVTEIPIARVDPELRNSKTELAAELPKGTQSNANKLKYTELKPYKELIKKHKALNPSGISKMLSKVDKDSTTVITPPKKNLPPLRSTMSKSLDRTFVEDTNVEVESLKTEETPSRNIQPFVSKASVRIDPPPFLTKRDEMVPAASFVEMGLGSKRNLGQYGRVQTPWPSYSDHAKTISKRSLVTYPSVPLAEKKVECHTQKKSQVHSTSTEKIREVEAQPKMLKKSDSFGNVPQRRTISTEHLNIDFEVKPPSKNKPKAPKSSIYISKGITKLPVASNSVSLTSNNVNLSTSHSYAKSSKWLRRHEPKSCKPPEKKKRCFLPSKVRLKPPECITTRPCPIPPPCPPRADDCLKICPKKLPVLKDTNCKCVEPPIPSESPRLKRLKVKIVECPRECPCVPTECPCPPPPRADDCLEEKVKKLVPIKPGNCKCIDSPPMIDVPLPRLEKVEIPEPCRVKCIIETCEDRDRADDCMKICPKTLPKLEPKPCPCVEHRMEEAPRLKRLNLKVPEPPRVCPVITCPEYECARADDCAPEKIKKLRTIKPGECPCIERPMIEAPPIPRLKCVDEPVECVCEDPCIPFPRADLGCWEYLQEVEKPKCSKEKGGQKKNVYHKQKSRKYNTDSKINLKNMPMTTRNNLNCNLDNRRNMSIGPKERSNVAIAKSEKDPLKKRRTPPKVLASKSTVTTKNTKDTEPYLVEKIRNNSLPTLFLLKELDEKNIKNNNLAFPEASNKLNSVLFPPPQRQSNSLLTPNVRKLSTTVTNARNSSSKSSDKDKSHNKKNSDEKLIRVDGKCLVPEEKCPKINKCAGSMVLKNCPAKTARSCDRDRTPVCCEKKTSPNPAFSECMDEAVEPFSKTSQWTCDRKEYGFEPISRKQYPALDSVKDKKKFSTLSAHGKVQNENPIVNYFSARYGKTDVAGQIRENSGTACISDPEVLHTDDGCEQVRKRESSTFTDTMNDVTECRVFKKEHSMDEKRLLTQRSTYTVAGINSRKMSTLRVNGKTRITFTALPSPLCRSFSTKRREEKECKKKKKKKNKKCHKFVLDNCPDREVFRCNITSAPVVCQKTNAPYRSFSELIDEEMVEKLAECPLEKDKIQLLQPRYPIPLEKGNILEPVEPQQGRIDPLVEEKCIREKLCMPNEGLSQECTNFGEFVRPLKSKRFFKERNADCEKIEEMKKQGKDVPKQKGKFSTSSSGTFKSQKRDYSSTTTTVRETDDKQENLLNKRSLHTAYSIRDSAEEVDAEIAKSPLEELEEPCKYMKLRNVQWRINNLQGPKAKQRNYHPHFAKCYHTCTKLKNRAQNTKHYYTVKKVNLPTQTGTICSNVVYGGDKENSHKNLSISPMKNTENICEVYKYRGFSTTMCLAKESKSKCIRFPLYPKPGKKPLKTKPNSHSNLPKVIQPQKGKRKPLGQSETHKIKSLQPRYPCVPEVDTVSIPPFKSKNNSNWEKECLIHFTEKEESKCYDCSAVEKPFIRLNSSSLQSIKHKLTECMCNEKDIVPCTPCGEVFMHRNKVYMKGKGKPCPKLSKSDPCEKPKKSRPRTPTKPPSFFSSLLKAIADYFKANPNCPSPDEWKKKALRQKAEKAAKAAGLCLYDPYDLPPNVSKINNKRVKCKKVGKAGSDSSCFPARRNPCKTFKRQYCSRVKMDSAEDLKEAMEKARKKQQQEKMSQVFMEDANDNGCFDDDLTQKCPDPLFENILNQTILYKNSLGCLEPAPPTAGTDVCVKFSLKIVPSDISILDKFNEPSTDNIFNDIPELHEMFNKADSMSEVTYEELEKAKTKTLVKELDKLLTKNKKSNKKN